MPTPSCKTRTTSTKRACVACQQNKRKCEGFPCARCAKRGIPCVQALDRRSKQYKERKAGSGYPIVTNVSVPARLGRPVSKGSRKRRNRPEHVSHGARAALQAAASALYQSGKCESGTLLDQFKVDTSAAKEQSSGPAPSRLSTRKRQRREPERLGEEQAAATLESMASSMTGSEDRGDGSRHRNGYEVALSLGPSAEAHLEQLHGASMDLLAAVATSQSAAVRPIDVMLARSEGHSASSSSSVSLGTRLVENGSRHGARSGAGRASASGEHSDSDGGRYLSDGLISLLYDSTDDDDDSSRGMRRGTLVPVVQTRIPASPSAGPLQMVKDSLGSVMMYVRKIPGIAPGLASMLMGQMNITTFVPPAIHAAVDRIMVPEGRAALPAAARDPAFFRQLQAHDDSVVSRLSRSATAASYSVLDPYTLRPIKYFSNKRAMQQLSDDPSFYFIIQKYTMDLTPMNPVSLFASSVCQLGSLVGRTRDADLDMVFCKYSFLDGRARVECFHFNRLMDEGAKEEVAIRLAIHYGDKWEEERDQAGATSPQTGSDFMEVCDTMHLKWLPPGRSEELTDDDLNMSTHRGDYLSSMPSFLEDRIVAVAYRCRVSVAFDWVGSCPRTSLVTVRPNGRIPNIEEYPAGVQWLRQNVRRPPPPPLDGKRGADDGAWEASNNEHLTPVGIARPRARSASCGSQFSDIVADEAQGDDVSVSQSPGRIEHAGGAGMDPGQRAVGSCARGGAFGVGSVAHTSPSASPMLQEGSGLLDDTNPNFYKQDAASSVGSLDLSSLPSGRNIIGDGIPGFRNDAFTTGGLPGMVAASRSTASGTTDSVNMELSGCRSGSVTGGSQQPLYGCEARASPSVDCEPSRRQALQYLPRTPFDVHSVMSRPGQGLVNAAASVALSSISALGANESLGFGYPGDSVGFSPMAMQSQSEKWTEQASSIGSSSVQGEHADRCELLSGSRKDVNGRSGRASRSNQPAMPSAASSAGSSQALMQPDDPLPPPMPWGGHIPDQVHIRPFSASQINQLEPAVGSATTYVQAPRLGLPYSGCSALRDDESIASQLTRTSTSSSAAFRPALHASSNPTREGDGHSRGDAAEAPNGADVRTGGAGGSSAASSTSHAASAGGLVNASNQSRGAGLPRNAAAATNDPSPRPMKRARTARHQAGPVSASMPHDKHSAPVDGMEEDQPQGAAPAPLSVSSSGVTEDVAKLLTAKDRANLGRRVFYMWEIKQWTQDFAARLQEPGARLGEELTRQIIACSQRRQPDMLKG